MSHEAQYGTLVRAESSGGGTRHARHAPVVDNSARRRRPMDRSGSGGDGIANASRSVDGAARAAVDVEKRATPGTPAALDPAGQRRAAGRGARQDVPRSVHADWKPAPDRADPVAILVGQERGRDASLLSLRHGRMAASAFAFYRGGAAIMAADLAGTPDSGIRVQLSGDAHLLNFGAYAAPDRRLVFDLDDFDETCPGPWEWDVKRLAASLEIAARERRRGAADGRALVLAAVGGYRAKMRDLALRSDLDAWYDRIDVAQLLATVPSATERAAVQGVLTAAATRDNVHSFAKLTALVDGHRQFVDRPPTLERLPAGALRKRVTSVFERYPTSLADDQRVLLSRFRLVDVARKVVGVGSVGLAAYVGLYLGRDDDDPLVLQAKEAVVSVLEPAKGRPAIRHQGRRVVDGQRLMQAASDTFLGWADGSRGASYYVRQLADMRWSLDVARVSHSGMLLAARLCGQALARAHARSGDRIAIAGYLGSGDTFDRAIAAFASAYADRNALDLHALQAAIADGRLSATPG
jgi:uncharacterized protein (DUF2252 family)